MAIRIVTDSTSDLSPELRETYGIEMVPLTVHFGPESYLDAVELDHSGFWQQLAQSAHHPKTAQPSPGDFLEVYKRIHAEGDEILSIHLSSNLSGTMNSAQIAAQMLPEAKISLVDTKSVSLGLGMVAIEAAKMARAGKSMNEILTAIQPIYEGMNIFFTLDTLDFLQKNGRIGKAQALLGGLLGIKAILQVDGEGFVAPADKVRGRSRVLSRTLQLLQERIPAGRKVHLAVLHTQAPDEAAAWGEEAKRLYQVEEMYISEIGSVVATNVGPGTLGFCIYALD